MPFKCFPSSVLICFSFLSCQITSPHRKNRSTLKGLHCQDKEMKTREEKHRGKQKDNKVWDWGHTWLRHPYHKPIPTPGHFLTLPHLSLPHSVCLYCPIWSCFPPIRSGTKSLSHQQLVEMACLPMSQSVPPVSITLTDYPEVTLSSGPNCFFSQPCSWPEIPLHDNIISNNISVLHKSTCTYCIHWGMNRRGDECDRSS